MFYSVFTRFWARWRKFYLMLTFAKNAISEQCKNVLFDRNLLSTFFEIFWKFEIFFSNLWKCSFLSVSNVFCLSKISNHVISCLSKNNQHCWVLFTNAWIPRKIFHWKWKSNKMSLFWKNLSDTKIFAINEHFFSYLESDGEAFLFVSNNW